MTILVTHDVHLGHRSEGHPECPERVVAAMKHLEKSGILGKVTRLPARNATEEELRLVHTPAHIDLIRRLSQDDDGWIDADTYVCPRSYSAAVMSVGGVLAACEALLAGRDSTALCLVRPPGHHATPEKAMGFCLFNNVAIAAKSLKRRTLIVDWDVHHGNGTQAAVENDPNIFFISFHRYPFYPGTGTAEERGRGNVVNVPLEGSTDPDEYLLRFETAVSEAVEKFRPEFALISAGFDTYYADPVGGLGFEEDDYGALTEIVLRILGIDVPVVSVLEGGYHLRAIGPCIEAHLKALLNRGWGEDHAKSFTQRRKDAEGE